MIRYCLILLFLSSLGLQAQELLFSNPKKVPAKVSEYEILGKNDQGVVVWKTGANFNMLETYDPNTLKLNWTREMPFAQRKQTISSVLAIHNRLYVLYLIKDKRNIKVYMRELDSQLKLVGQEVLIDEYKRKFGSYGYQYEIVYDWGRKHMVVVKKEMKTTASMETQVHMTWLDRDLTIQHSASFMVAENWRFSDCLVKEDGTVFVIEYYNKRGLLSQYSTIAKIKLTRFNFKTDERKYVILEDSQRYFDDFSVEYDPINKKLVAAGFFNQNNSDRVYGYFYGSAFSPENPDGIDLKFVDFNEELIKKVGRKTIFGQDKGLQYIEIRHLILRSDGGGLLVGESHSTNGISSPLSPIYDMRFASRRQSLQEHFFDDVVIFSIDKDGDLDWSEILKKKQYSENDDGYFSSIGFMNAHHNIHLIFNESISSNVNMNDFNITGKGEYRIKSLFSPNEFKISPAPRYAVQISPKELIIPGINHRNEFLLLKLTY